MVNSASGILIGGGSVISGAGDPRTEPTDVLLQGDTIVAIGSEAAPIARAAEAAGSSIERIDATGCTVMPGLIDAHCHITFGEPASNDELFFHRDQSMAAFVAAFNVGKLLLAGVTGFLDPDGLWNLGPALRDAIEAGIVEGPRMSAGMNALLTAAGGTAGRLIPDSGKVGYAHVVTSRDEMIRTTRQQIKYGADWIKIHVTGSLPSRAGELTVWSLDELRAVTDTAHALDTPTMAHCRSAHSTRLAAEAGVDLILHASYLDEAALDAVVAAGSALVPTFTFLANLADYGSMVGTSATQADLFRGEIEATAAMLRVAHEAGVPILAGSESGFALTPYGHWHAREIEILVEAVGLTPLEAIRCATYNGARALRMEPGEIGFLGAGAKADVVVIDGDPSVDVGLLGDRSTIRHVISRGRPVDLNRPWPQRKPLPGEKVGNWATELLTRDLAHR
jgi:imidazolonepropionase-like amidohydrolase